MAANSAEVTSTIAPYGIRRTPCWTFCDRAARTWADLLDGWAGGMAINEETLTEANLLAIWRAHHPLIQYIRFSRHEEHERTGADWEWWFSAPGRWLGLRFQAKKLTKGGRYDNLNTKRGRAQANVLINNSSQDGVIPMYVFYNAWKKTPTTTWNCGTFPNTPQLLGCSVSPATVIRPLLNKGARKLATTISSHSLPWSCLVCCEGFSSSNVTLPERTADFLSTMWAGIEVVQTDELQELGDIANLLHESPPAYLAEALAYRLSTTTLDSGPPAIATDVVAPVRHVVVAFEPPSKDRPTV